MRIVVIIPGNASTGGVELLYQFVDAANAAGADAYVCNHPFNGKTGSPEEYCGYKYQALLRSEIQADDIIVLPEIFTYLANEFPRNALYLWWMSVDNYYGSKRARFIVGNKFFPWRFKSISKASFSSCFDGHLCQSEYAILHLKQHGIDHNFVVSDYINRDFVESTDLDRNKVRKDLIVYNPAKGVEQTTKIMEFSKYEFRPIKNMTRAQIIELLLTAKLYIDFGSHPGKDRIPREAAALGCVVMTNRRGSARNDVDVPIDPELKIDDTSDHFAELASKRIDEIMNNFSMYNNKFETYRKIIFDEKRTFFASVAEFVRVTGKTRVPPNKSV
jgi:hypothetical protein